MNTATFAEWLRRQGHWVTRSASSYWYDAGPHVLQAFPYHWLIEPSEAELRGVMLRHGVVALRYSTPLAAPSGMVSYHVVLHGPYDLDSLRSQARNGVRRGLEHFSVERITFARLAAEGWALQRDTLERQGRMKSMSQSEWERICFAAEWLPGFEAWGATQRRCPGRGTIHGAHWRYLLRAVHDEPQRFPARACQQCLILHREP